MLLSSLLLTPILGVLAILINKDNRMSLANIKWIALTTSILNFFISLVSNWKSITKDVESYVIIILLLETLLLAVFLVLDILLFYIFFESILPPLFILIGIFGSDNRVKASFYLFLYTLLGSLFLLLSILAMSSIMSTTDFDTLFKGNFVYLTQLFLFYGIFIAFAVKTPTIFLNTWLLKAHVESPLGGSIILAAIVLKLSLYGILRLILPILPKAYMEYTYIIFLIGVITIVYASLSTLRTIDIKELIAYSSVSHAAVYLLAVFSNSIQGIEGAINLGLAHGLVSPGLFICAGGVLYDRSSTRVISFYKGVTQVMPLFAILFFILCLANCGAPLSLNFIGEFLSLYGVFERSSLFGVFASSSIIFSAAYTIYMYQRIAFGGTYSSMFVFSIPDLTKREFTILFILVLPTVFFGIYPSPILDAIHYSVSTLIYCFDFDVINCDSPKSFEDCEKLIKEFTNHTFVNYHSLVNYHTFFALLFWTFVIVAAIKNRFYIKNFIIDKTCRLFLYFILANISLSFIAMILYIIYMFITLYFTIYYEFLPFFFEAQYALSTDTDSCLKMESVSSEEWKKHIWLSSGNNPNPNTTTTNTGGETPKVSIFKPNWQQTYTPYVPSPPKQPVLVHGQGDNPVLYTLAEHGDKLNSENTFNIAPGYADKCDRVDGKHLWNKENACNRLVNDGPCFGCGTTLETMHYRCELCFRRLCSGCDGKIGYVAENIFSNRIVRPSK